MDSAIEVYQREPTDQETLPPDPFRDIGYALQQLGAALTDFAEAFEDVWLDADPDIIDADFSEIER